MIGENGPQPHSTAMQSCLQSRLRKVQHRGGFGATHAFDITQHHDGALVERQLPERGTDRFDTASPLCAVRRRVGAVEHRDGPGFLERSLWVAHAASTHQRSVHRDAVEPGRDRGVTAKLQRVAPNMYERVLGGFGDIAWVIEHSTDDRCRLFLVGADEIGEGNLIAAAYAVEKNLRPR